MLSKRPILIASLLTLLAFAESTIAPWAPLILIYAALLIIIPLVSGSCCFGSFKKALAAHWRLLLVCVVAMTIWDRIFTRLFSSLSDELPIFLASARYKLHASALSAEETLVLFLLIWAPIGEEFFYRGYLQGNLRNKMPFVGAMLIATIFFAIRHGLHLIFLYPNVPWSACVIWVMLAFGWGMALGWLYEKSRSLYLPVMAHFLANCFSLI